MSQEAAVTAIVAAATGVAAEARGALRVLGALSAVLEQRDADAFEIGLTAAPAVAGVSQQTLSTQNAPSLGQSLGSAQSTSSWSDCGTQTPSLTEDVAGISAVGFARATPQQTPLVQRFDRHSSPVRQGAPLIQTAGRT